MMTDQYSVYTIAFHARDRHRIPGMMAEPQHKMGVGGGGEPVIRFHVVCSHDIWPLKYPQSKNK